MEPPQPSGLPPKQPVPRGVMVIGILLYLGAVVLVATTALPNSYLLGIPRLILLLGALASGVLATGLFRKRRWAWFGALAFALVNGYYLYLRLFHSGQNQIIGLTLLALMIGYLLLPHVRKVYLGSSR